MSQDVGESAEADGSDEARRGLAALLLSRDGKHFAWTPHWRWPIWASALMADTLLLPADHPSVSASAVAGAVLAADRICAACLPADPDSAHAAAFSICSDCFASDADRALASGLVIFSERSVTNWFVRQSAFSTDRDRAKLPTGPGPQPYAFRTPDDLRHSALLCARLRIRHRLGPWLGARPARYDLGFRLGLEIIERSLPSSDYSWTDPMAHWAVALAQCSGGLLPLHKDVPRSPLGFAPTPFSLLLRAVMRAPIIANALLDIATTDRFAVDVDNQRGEPGRSRVDEDWGFDATKSNLVHVMLRLPVPDLPLFRRIVQRCSADTLNDDSDIRASPLHSIVRFCCSDSSLGGPVHQYPDSKEMLTALLARSEPDGGGLNLYQRAPWSGGEWEVGKGMDTTAYYALTQHIGSQAMRGELIAPLIAAFDDVFQRQRAYRTNLPLALDSILGAPSALSSATDPASLPVRELLRLIAEYVLHPVPDIPAPQATPGLSTM
jgi:hypothetical protein